MAQESDEADNISEYDNEIDGEEEQGEDELSSSDSEQMAI